MAEPSGRASLASGRAVRAAVVDAHEIDGAGVVALLARYEGRVQLGDLTPETEVILYGVRRSGRHDAGLHALLHEHSATVIVLGWASDLPELERAMLCGADGQLSKTVSAEQLVAGVESIHGARRTRSLEAERWGDPAVRLAELAPRELEVLRLISRGLTNQEIADQLFVSINSVKTYVRTAYRKIGVSRRPHAVGWGVQHGLDGDCVGSRAAGWSLRGPGPHDPCSGHGRGIAEKWAGRGTRADRPCGVESHVGLG